MAVDTSAIRPWHLAVLMPTCAEERDGGVAVTSRLGRQIERMAELVEHTTILGYEPPASPNLEDRTDYVMRPAGGRITLVSLGPKGTYRDYLARRRRVHAIVDARSDTWDVLSTPLVNRRVGLVYFRSKCRRVMAQIGDHGPSATRNTPVAWRKKFLTYLNAVWVERAYRRIARESLFFVNGEALLPYYRRGGAVVDVVRTSARRATESCDVPDRLTGDAPKLVTLSRLSAIKGIDDAIKAFARLRDGSMPDAQLHIIGGGPVEAQMRSLAESLGVAEAIVWHGWVSPGPPLYEILRHMDVLLTLSHFESLPKTVWECASQSVLVVATPVGAMSQVFKDEHDLLFVPEYAPDAAAKAVERLASDAQLRQRLLVNGRAAAAKVTVEAVCEEILERVERKWPELPRA
ncbi:MAG TPA: glycosyltransferase family 4 protein [Acidimicrobiales bacterium]|nr:glycosyltransferase family 4 protein [Acidimicrobiales bacterium]